MEELPPNRCPFCQAVPCLPLWRKFMLGMRSRARCRTCGCRVSVEVLRSSAAMMPTFLLIMLVGSGLLTDVVAMVLGLIACLAFMFGLYAVWVPLMPAQLASQTMIEAGKARMAARRTSGAGTTERRNLSSRI